MGSGVPGGIRTVLVHEYVTGGGMPCGGWTEGLVREGHAMRRALARDLAAVAGLQVLMTLDSRLPAEEGPWELIAVEPGAEPDVVQRALGKVDAAVVVAPESEGLLTERVSWVWSAGCRPLVSTAAAVEMTAEKLVLGRHLEECGVLTPESRPVFRSEDLPSEEDWVYPAVLKPFDGVGSRATYFLSGPGDLEDEAIGELPALIQAYVPGSPMSASFLVGRDGAARLVAVGRQRVQLQEGRFVYHGGYVPAGLPAMAAEARRAVEAVPGLRGWVGVDFVWNEASAQAVVLEINPRLTTSFVGLCEVAGPGVLARAWLEAVLGEPAAVAEPAAWVHGREGVGFRPDGSIVRGGGVA